MHILYNLLIYFQSEISTNTWKEVKNKQTKQKSKHKLGMRFNGLFYPIITKSYNNKCNTNHMREQMLDEDPAKREAWSAESSALIYTTGTLKLHII